MLYCSLFRHYCERMSFCLWTLFALVYITWPFCSFEVLLTWACVPLSMAVICKLFYHLLLAVLTAYVNLLLLVLGKCFFFFFFWCSRDWLALFIYVAKLAAVSPQLWKGIVLCYQIDCKKEPEFNIIQHLARHYSNLLIVTGRLLAIFCLVYC